MTDNTTAVDAATTNFASPPTNLTGVQMTAVQLAAHFRKSPATIVRWAQEPDFPRATALNGEVHWPTSAVHDWRRRRQRAYRTALRAKEAAVEADVEKARLRQNLIAAFARPYLSQIRRSTVPPRGAPLSRPMIVQADGSLAPASLDDNRNCSRG